MKHYFLIKHSFYRPSVPTSCDECSFFDAEMACPLSQCSCLPVKGDINIGSFIAVLSCPGCPSAIFRGVATIIVNAIKRKPFRFLSHITKKVFKAVNPSITDFYASPPIARKMFAGSIGASLLHSSPDKVGFRMTFPVGSPCNIAICSGTATGLDRTSLKRVTSNYMGASTITGTVPPIFIANLAVKGGSGKTIKFLTRKVARFFHNIFHSILSMKDDAAICMETGVRVAFPSHRLHYTREIT